MSCLTGTAFWVSTISVSLMTVSFLSPFWLGRREADVQFFYGLWYNLECFNDHCSLFNDVFDSETITLKDRTWDFDLVVIPVLITIGLVLGGIATVILELVRCRRRKFSESPSHMNKIRSTLIATVVLLATSATATGIAVFISYYAADKYYSDNAVNYAGEFPWCILIDTIATVLITLGTILYLIIVCNWYKYSEYYEDTSSSNEGMINGGYYKTNSRVGSSYKESHRDSPKPSSYGGLPAFSSPPLALSHSQGLSSSMYGKSSGSGLGKSKLGGLAYMDFRSSRRTLSDINGSRKSNMPEYIKEHDDYIERLRQSRKREEEFDPNRLSVGVTQYRQSREDAYSGYSDPRSSRMSRHEPSVLDILYRESRNNTHL